MNEKKNIYIKDKKKTHTQDEVEPEMYTYNTIIKSIYSSHKSVSDEFYLSASVIVT